MAYFLFVKSEAPDSSWALLETIPNAVVAAKATRDYQHNIGRSALSDVKMVEAESEAEARTKFDPTNKPN